MRQSRQPICGHPAIREARVLVAGVLTGALPGPCLAAEGATARAGLPQSGELMQVVLGLLAVLAVIAALTFLLRHVFRFQPALNGQLRVLAGLSMGPRERVVLLKAGDTQLLLGVSPGRVQMLHVLERPVPETDTRGSATAPRFARELAVILNKAGRGEKRA